MKKVKSLESSAPRQAPTSQALALVSPYLALERLCARPGGLDTTVADPGLVSAGGYNIDSFSLAILMNHA